MQMRVTIALCAAMAAGAGGCLEAQEAQAPDWSAYRLQDGAGLNEPRSQACVASLGNGRALATGGLLEGVPSAAVEIYSADGGWRPAKALSVARAKHTCTLLADGRVMVAGGRGTSGAVGAIEIYDPAKDEWLRLPQSMIARWDHTATLLTDGRVLLAGGQNESRFFDSLEFIDPWFHTVTLSVSRLRSPRSGHAAAALPWGGALVAGGFNSTGFLAGLDIIEQSGRVAAGPNLPDGAAWLTATPLADRNVLLVGGAGAFGESSSALLYTPGNTNLKAAASMPAPRAGHLAALLEGNGRVLVVGGSAGETPAASILLYDPQADKWDSGLDWSGMPPGSLTVLSPGDLVALSDQTWTFSYPAIRLERSTVLPEMPVRLALAHVDGEEALVTATPAELPPGQEVERTVPVSGEFTELFTPAPETAGRQWAVSAVTAGGHALRTAFAQKARVRVSLHPAPSAPQAFEPTAFNFTLTREGGAANLPWPPALALRVTTQTEGSTASNFLIETPGDHAVPARTLAGGEYTAAVRLSSLHDLYESDPAVTVGTFTVTRRKPAAIDFTLPGGATAVGEARPVTASVRTGLPASIPRPTGVITVSRGGYARGEIILRSGGTGGATSNIALGQAGSHPVQFAYSGDNNYEPVTTAGPAMTIQKGTVALTLKPVKPQFGVGENAWIDATLTHPRVLGAIPTGSIQPLPNDRGMAATGAVVGGDPANSGTITVRVQAGALNSSASNVPVGFAYSGDENFNSRTATGAVSFVRMEPSLSFTAPVSALTGQSVTFEVVVGNPDELTGAKPATGAIQLWFGTRFLTGFTLFPKGRAAAATVTIGPFDTPGTFEYKLVYPGDMAYTETASQPFRITVR